MNEFIEQDPRYPEWMKAWNARAVEIDQQIIDYYLVTKVHAAEALEEMGRRLHLWWERQHMDAAARRQYENMRADDEAFQEQLNKRVQALILEGRIGPADGDGSRNEGALQ